jgi:hypothetical protein
MKEKYYSNDREYRFSIYDIQIEIDEDIILSITKNRDEDSYSLWIHGEDYSDPDLEDVSYETIQRVAHGMLEGLHQLGTRTYCEYEDE